MKPKRDDFVYVSHIIESIVSIQSFVKNVSYDEFKNNDMMLSAVIRKFEIMGEATSNISEDLKKKATHIEWQIVKNFRNHLIHQYFGVDVQTVWDAINENIEPLREKLIVLRNELEKNR
ncbi:MAG: DUF86 domain-containing protein [Fusobacteriaceae bacterium]|nr:DUF86 domain-containing protein [Fusobacteriaceae bacterium]MBN2838384.1 DUF86 domain-containing protein [Fusobacteriaceae bacterium]